MLLSSINKRIESFIFLIYKFSFLFISVPLFFDFGKMEFMIIEFNDYSPLDRPAIPFPVGGLSFLMAVISGYFLLIMRSDKVVAIFKPGTMIIFLFFYVIGLGIHSLYVSGLSLPRFIQLIFPAMLLAILTFPVRREDRLVILKFYVIGLLIVISSHFLSLVLTADNIMSVDDRSEFSLVFGLILYQALVSYPGVLSLAFFLSLAVLYRQLSVLPLVKGRSFTVMISLMVFILGFLGLSSGRKSFLAEFLTGFLIILMMAFFYGLVYRKTSLRSLMSLFLFVVFSFFGAFIYLTNGMSGRFVGSIESGNVDSGRLSILKDAFDFFYNNLDIFMLGAGGSGSPGMHNFFLDQIYRIGIFATFFCYFVFAYLIRRFYKKNNIYSSMNFSKSMYILIFGSCVLWQSMVNSSISQPYYLINVLVSVSFVLFVVFSKDQLHVSRMHTH